VTPRPRLLVKIGGAQLEDPQARADLAASVAAAAAGHELVLVHGGGKQIKALGDRLGLPEVRHEGLRVTDRATAEVVLQVLAGEVNKKLVQVLGAAGVRAVGLTGADGGLFSAAPHRPRGADLGYVGEVHQVDPTVARTLLAAGFTPVVATVAPLGAKVRAARDAFYNINADQVVGPLAAALECTAVLFLTDVPAVFDEGRTPVRHLDPAGCDRLHASGALSGGMLPKVEAALGAAFALHDGVVKIAPAAGRNAILEALTDDVGTTFQTTVARS